MDRWESKILKATNTHGLSWRDFIRRELENKRPIIIVCLGAQLIASAAGGDVEILKYGYPQKYYRDWMVSNFY